jgi:hypothetical protein
VDVALERDEQRVAIEISITTPAEHELQNLARCLAAGYDVVVPVSPDGKGRKRMQAAVGKVLYQMPHWIAQSISPTIGISCCPGRGNCVIGGMWSRGRLPRCPS